MKSQTITAVIPVFNEKKNIVRCIESVRWCDKIQVLSMGNDKTAGIARQMGVDVIEKFKTEKADFILVQKAINWAIDHCTTDWILRIDADEEATPELKEEIQVLIRKTDGNIVAYGIPRRQYFWGGFLKGGDWAYDRLVRLFRPSTARYDPIISVHEQFKVQGKIGYLKQSLNHYSHPKLSDAVHKFHTYTDVQVNDLHDSLILAVLKMIVLPPYIFARWMIWHKGYLDGLRGVVAGAFRAWYEFLLYTKYVKKLLKQKDI